MGERSTSRRYRRLSDTRLAELIREGDARAFEALYDRHQPSLLAFCRHMLGRPPRRARTRCSRPSSRAHKGAERWAGTRCDGGAMAVRDCPQPLPGTLLARRDAVRRCPRISSRGSTGGRRASGAARTSASSSMISRDCRTISARRWSSIRARRAPATQTSRRSSSCLPRQGQGARLPGAHGADRRARRTLHSLRGHPRAARGRARRSVAARAAAPTPPRVCPVRQLPARSRRAA